MLSTEEEFQSANKLRTAQLSQMTEIYNEIERAMISVDNAECVKDKYSKLCERFEKFNLTHLKALEVCGDSNVIDTLKQNFESSKLNFIEFQNRYSEWIGVVENDDFNVHDRSLQTRRPSIITTVSPIYKLKSAKEKRLTAESKLISLHKKHDLERNKLEIDRKLEILEQQSLIEEAAIEESVWQETIKEETSICSSDNWAKGTNNDFDFNQRTFVTDSEVITLNEQMSTNKTPTNDKIHTNYTSFFGRSHDNDARGDSRRLGQINANTDVSVNIVDTAFNKLATALNKGFNLPKPELLTFSGKATEYCKFIKNFETNIESKVSDDSQRLSYLIQCCFGEAKLCIEDCVLFEPSEGYRRARDILFSRYGRPHVIARTYIDNLVHGPKILSSDVEGISKLSIEMQKCEITLSKLGFAGDIDNTENLRRIVKRLPMQMRERWIENANVINESGREIGFSDLSKFVEEKSRILNSVYGMDLVKENKSGKENFKVTSVSSYGGNTTGKRYNYTDRTELNV